LLPSLRQKAPLPFLNCALPASAEGNGGGSDHPPDAPLPAEGEKEASPYHILLIDDDQLNNSLLVLRIQALRQQIECSMCLNGAEALQKLTALEKGHNDRAFPDMILLDIDMPVMNGFEFLRQYEKQFYARHRATRILMVSSSTLKEDRRKVDAFEIVSQFVSKPFPLSLIP